jgi:hypothetical protein
MSGGHLDAITSLDWSNDGSMIATGSADKNVGALPNPSPLTSAGGAVGPEDIPFNQSPAGSHRYGNCFTSRQS